MNVEGSRTDLDICSGGGASWRLLQRDLCGSHVCQKASQVGRCHGGRLRLTGWYGVHPWSRMHLTGRGGPLCWQGPCGSNTAGCSSWDQLGSCGVHADWLTGRSVTEGSADCAAGRLQLSWCDRRRTLEVRHCSRHLGGGGFALQALHE